VAGKEPEKEQKGTYTHSTFHRRKSGMAYQSFAERVTRIFSMDIL
jgi:hypothetical protein